MNPSRDNPRVANGRRPTGALMTTIAWIFALVLGATTLWLGGVLTASLVGTWQARVWEEVPATLHSWSAQSSRTMTPLVTESTMQRLQARYSWEFGGRRFEGERVGFSPLADNMGWAWRDAVVERLRAAEGGAPLAIRVDPAKPSRAVVEASLAVDQAAFIAVFLAFPCGFITLLAIGAGLQAMGAMTGQVLTSLQWPLWALLHGAVAVPVWLLAAPHSVEGFGAVALGGLALLGLAGAVTLLRALRGVFRAD